MTRRSLVAYRDLASVAEAAGFNWVRGEGSHNTLGSPERRIVVIPDHGSQVIVRPLHRKIVRDLGLSVEEYHRLLVEP